ncbi:glycoside hydrolase family 47 protein [Laetiporus sulphureus 93-53]|uniref:alpha-1,2-Mannosidase n=1 Tax=Laetiporus sulphureus 93-53 TaxID=1314785 RepID=A0A165EP90_9APHY|nr:glycoside hydrolase family 47 protein [Laetiporus sulphureus 93-53]KZT07477.1 glycoside hydrolase family 47 protein [Laetiporus sulphureus 93-53]
MLSHMLSSVLDSFKYRRVHSRHLGFAAFACLVILTLYYFTLPRHDKSAVHYRSPFVSNTSREEWRQRAEQVKQAFRHAYSGYEKHAWGYDELLPLTNGSKNNFNGWGVMLFDSLDTMIMMDLHDEFARALKVVERADFSPNPSITQNPGFAPFFETVIRYLGGLLAAYALSHEPILLQRADDLGRMLSPAFDTPVGFPMFGVNTVTGETIGPVVGILAEIASCQLEYTYLAQLTGRRSHWENADVVVRNLANAGMDMLPRRWNLETGRPIDLVLSVGAASDSAHEYLLKQYLLTAQTDKESYQMYLRTTNHILTHMLYLSENRELLYVTDTSHDNFAPSHRFEHLSCFLPGLFALGADQLDLSLDHLDRRTLRPEGRRAYDRLKGYDLRELHRWAAEGLATSCYLMYADQSTGIGPDEVIFQPKMPAAASETRWPFGSQYQGKLWIDYVDDWRKRGQRGVPPGLGDKPPVRFTEEELKSARLRKMRVPERDYVIHNSKFLLRPETIESLYIMWRTTGDPIWRERGWALFEAIERETKTDSGYASALNVLASPAPLMDDMPSYFLAETLKYLYLLFHEEDIVPLDRWVFNTEAHPFPVFSWSPWERSKFGIPTPSLP